MLAYGWPIFRKTKGGGTSGGGTYGRSGTRRSAYGWPIGGYAGAGGLAEGGTPGSYLTDEETSVGQLTDEPITRK
jgi:hypothetical protein